MHSFVIRIAILVNRAEPLEFLEPTPGFFIDNLLELIVESDLYITSVIITKTFFLLKKFYTFL